VARPGFGGRAFVQPLAAVLLLAAVLAATALPVGAGAAPPQGVPELELDGVLPLEKERCVLEGNDPYEKRIYKIEGWKAPDFERYPGACERLRFAYGPIVIEPGKNNALLEPVTIQSPRRTGYITRFEPNLVLADGTVPPVERVHLHHGTWLSDNAIYQGAGSGAGNGYFGLAPFIAAGEEKTIGTVPKGYGMPHDALDQWFLLYMVHSAVPTAMVGYITYDIDFVPQAKAEQLGIKPIYSTWLDVRPTPYPVFNVQRRFGDEDGTCTWPAEQCAEYDPWGSQIVGQGEPGNGTGTDLTFPGLGEPAGPIRHFTGGTLIAIAGHLHPGGLTDSIDLIRNGRSKRIFTSEAIYWNRKNSRKPGGPPTSWDLSMTGTGLPYWSVRVKPGDTLRINGTADTRHASTYENMGIVIAGLAPDDENGKPTAPGVDPFKVRRDRSKECTNLRKRIRGPVSDLRDVGLKARGPKLCPWGLPTHGHQAANGNFGGPSGQWAAPPGPPTQNVNIANFQYYPGDLSRVKREGVPQVPLGSNLNFINLDGAAILHTITTCKFPCLGPTGAAFPLPDGQTSIGRNLDLDSSQVGLGVPVISGATNRLTWMTPITREAGYQPGETITYFCRIHPFMRGAFQVTD
jgi:hypothetical protein